MPTKTTSRPLAIAALTALVGLAACGDEKDAREAFHQANIEFQSAATGDEIAHRDHAAAAYNRITQLVQDHAGDGSGYAEAAAVSLAQARLGEASQAAIEAGRVESQAIRQARVIRANLSEYLSLSAIAQAASVFDPAADIAELDRLLDLRRDDAAHYAAEKQQIENQIADLDAQIAALRAKADAERRKAGEIELSMTGVSAQRAAELAAEAREHTLRADQYQLEAVRLDGRVGQLRPTAAEIDLKVGNAASQIAMLERSQEELRERARASQEDAAEARAAARAARDRLTQLGESLRDFRQSEVRTKSDAIFAKLRQAEQALSDARGPLAGSASATRAAIKEATAAAHSAAAAGHTEAAAAFAALAAAGVPGGFDQDADSANAEAIQASDEAKSAFRDAASALRSMRATGEAGDKVEQAAVRFEALAGIEQEEPADDMSYDSSSEDDWSSALADTTDASLEDLLAGLPEDMRAEVMAQLQTQLDMLNSIDDPEILRETLEQMDQMAPMMPAEAAPGLDFVRRTIENRIAELEGEG